MGPPQQQVRPANRSGASGSSGGIGTTPDQDDAFRSQINQEIERKAKVCANTLYECSLARVDSYAYCFRHILQDPKAPYKQCGYLYPNGRRCLEPTPRYDAKKDYGSNFCFEHSRQTQLAKTKSTIGKLVPVETTETLLHSLAHHVKLDKTKQHYMGNNTPLKITVHEDDDDNDVDVVTPSVDPFVDVDVAAINDSGRIVLDYASDSSSEDEETQQPTYGSSWKGQDMDNSDNESVDSQGDDPLKHAGIYTAEETTRITKEKLSRLQSLYMEQIHRLQHVLRERRRNFLREQRAECETHCSIYDQINETPRERKLYEKLKGLNRYHRKHGVEAILQRKYLEKRAKATEGLQQKPPPLPKCSYTEGGVKCGERTLPCCKHCRKHVLEDKKQVLFRACGIEKSAVVCQEPLVGLFENATCPLHVELPAQRSFNKRKYESESDGEAESSGIAMDGTSLPVCDSVTMSGETEADANKHTSFAGTGCNTAEDNKGDAKDALLTDVKLVVKPETKRRSIKQEVATPPRVRNTRAARAALDRQQQKQHRPAVDRNIKQEKPEPTSDPGQQQQNPKETEESNVTISHSHMEAHESSSASVRLDEEQLPVSFIPNKKLKLTDDREEQYETTVESTGGQEEKMDTIAETKVDSKSEPDKPSFHDSTDRTTHAMEEQTSEEVEKPLDIEMKDEVKENVAGDEKNIKEIKVNLAANSMEVPTDCTEEATISKENSEALKKETRDKEEVKAAHSSAEPSKRRRTVAAAAAESREEQKREKSKQVPERADKVEPAAKDDPSSMLGESKKSTTTSDEEKGNKAKQQQKNKPDAPDVGTAKSGEKTRRQNK